MTGNKTYYYIEYSGKNEEPPSYGGPYFGTDNLEDIKTIEVDRFYQRKANAERVAAKHNSGYSGRFQRALVRSIELPDDGRRFFK